MTAAASIAQILNPASAQAFLDMLDACHLPISDITPSHWYEQNMTMPEGSAFPGAFNYNITPYWREVVDCFDKNHPAKTISIMGGAQIGKSAGVLMPLIGYSIKNNPGRMLFLTGHSDLSDEAMDNIDFMLLNTGLSPIVGTQVIRKKNNRSGDTLKVKEFPGGHLRMGSVTNDNLLRQRDVMIIIVDDFDAAKRSSKSAGSKKVLVEQRQAMFEHKRKTCYVSSPQIKGDSNIHEVFLLGDQRYYHVPCPNCGTMIILQWSTPFIGQTNPNSHPLKAVPAVENQSADSPLGAGGEGAGIYYQVNSVNQVIPSSVGYVCQHCAGFFNESHKYEMNLNGRWTPTAQPVEQNHYSYQLSSLYGPPGAFNWVKYAQVHANANPSGQAQKLSEQQSFENIVLGLPYEIPAEAPQGNQLQNNCRNYSPGTVPETLSIRDGNGAILLLTCAADLNGTEDDARLDYEVLAWSSTGASYSITHGSIGTFIPMEGSKKYKADREHFTYRHGAHNSVWPLFDQVLNTVFNFDTQRTGGGGPRRMKVALTALDTGHYTTNAYAYIDKTNHNVVGVKGDKDNQYRKYGIDTPKFHPAKERNKLFILESNQIKDELASHMQLKWDPGNQLTQPHYFMNYPQPQDGLYLYPTFFKHYEAEERQTEIKDGQGIASRWQKKASNLQNHFWDVRCYNIAARDIFTYLMFKELKQPDPHRRTWPDYAALINPSKP